ncbi:deoxynucleoside triphosphate triphosphohydrolase SAMHD1-like [Haliotis asinina]|uniref:deoxynucleoside triphosphate triphosphohydrolase SAMHD1-like n=1 Tax=Haliotis asinina TaxID=109174 RepID=UPI00353210EE
MTTTQSLVGIPMELSQNLNIHVSNDIEHQSDSDSNLSKIFKDPIHGTIRVTGLCVKIIDTPQFQRLRYLKQLGGGSFVYPGATHTRFEHSIGTYYLAGKFARILEEKHQGRFQDGDIECIEIAALCHDLGHGPFSHVFDNRFIPRVKPGSTWKHEEASVQMLEYLLKENEDVKKAFEEFDKDGSRLELIKDIILGGKQTKYVKEALVEEKRKKRFLYEIVANDKTGIDVDKWDYFARDGHMMGIKGTFDQDRYMELARIIDVDEECPRICARNNEASNLYDMFHTRMMLHRRACQHKVTIGVELMIVDVLQTLDDIVQIPGEGGQRRKISECIDDIEAYSKLNDSILQLVEDEITLGTKGQDAKETTEKLKTARTILKRLRSRDLYKCVGKHILSAKEDVCMMSFLNIEQAKEEILEEGKKEILEEGKKAFKGEHFEIVVGTV